MHLQTYKYIFFYHFRVFYNTWLISYPFTISRLPIRHILFERVSLTDNAGYTLKDLYNLIRSSKWERSHTWGQLNPIFNRFSPIVCGVLRCDEDSTPHTNRSSTRVPTKHGETSLNIWRLTTIQTQIKLGWALFVTYTIIQSIMRSEMCSLHLTHPSVHTWSSGQPTVQRPGSSRGLPVGAGIRTHNLGLPRVSSPTLYPLGQRLPTWEQTRLIYFQF